jgi:predicted RNA-binding protein with RPS1 domain
VKVLDVDARGRIKLSMKEVKVDVEEKIIAAVDEEGAGEPAE